MTFRARLSLTWLEARENPSTPTADPYGGEAPPPVDPPPPTDPALTAEDACVAGATTDTTTTSDPLTTTNTVYKDPLVP